VVFDPSGKEAHTVSERIGHGTNNEAEYRAAIAGLEAALALGARDVQLRMDSELIVRQLQHRYRVKNERLIPLFQRLVDLRRRFDSCSVAHVPRALNKRADQLANLALDTAPE
jgi:ribonuclease HI